MRIASIISSHRNDFTAKMECEHCGHHQVLKYGYHDAHYHEKVIPTITCEMCKKDRSGEIPEIDNPNGFTPVP